MPRLHFVPALSAFAVATIALVADPTRADAQILKRIGRAVAERASEDAASRAGGRDSSAASSSTTAPVSTSRPGVTSAAVTSSATRPSATLEITTERLDAFVAGMRPLISVMERQRAHVTSENRRQEYQKCSLRLASQPVAPPRGADAEIERLAATSKSVMEQLLAASQARDTAAVRRLRDLSLVLTDRQMVVANPAIRTQCTRALPVAELSPAARDSAGPAARIASGMSSTQLGRLRERIALYLLAPNAPNDLTAEERKAIDARRTQLVPIVALMRDGTLAWKTWYDLGRGWDGNS